MRSGRRNRYDVAFYVPWIGPLLTNAEATPTGGAETQIYLVARALAERGVRVCLLAFELPGVQLPRDVGGVAVRLRRPYQAHRRFGKLRETLTLAGAILRSGAGVIVTRSAGPHVGLVAVAAKLSGRRFVFSTANVSDFDFNRLSPNRVNDALFRLGVRLADQVIVQTVEQTRMCAETFDKEPALIKSIAFDGLVLDAFVEKVRQFDLKQLARTGPIVIRESDPATEYEDPHAGDAGTHSLTARALSPQESAR